MRSIAYLIKFNIKKKRVEDSKAHNEKRVLAKFNTHRVY